MWHTLLLFFLLLIFLLRADTAQAAGPDPATITLKDLKVFPVPEFYVKGANPYQDTLDAARDILTLEETDRCHSRYLSFYNLTPTVRKPFAEYVLRYHLNLLSRETDFAFGIWVTPTVLRVDLRDFDFKREIWDKSASIDVYYHVRALIAETPRGKRTLGNLKTSKRVDALAPWLPGLPVAVLVFWTSEPGVFNCKSPILRADWFMVQTARQFSLRNDERTEFGYYDFLRVKSRDDWFKLVRLDEQLAIKAQRETRAVVDISGVSAQNRQIVRLQSINGGVWGTLDVFDESDQGVAKNNLRRDEFRHDAEEWFGPLSNGLPATLANAADGTLQSNAPDKIGPNDSPRRRGKDGRIHVNLACLQCHDPNVLRPIDDWVRKTYIGGFKLGSISKRVDKELKRQYFSDLKDFLSEDNRAYEKAIWRCVQLKPTTIHDQYSAAFYRYSFERIGLDRGAEEWGTSKVHLLAALKSANSPQGVGRLHPTLLGFLKVPDYKVTRLEFEDIFGVGASIVAGFVPPDQ